MLILILININKIINYFDKKIVVFDIDGTLIKTDTLLICLKIREISNFKKFILFSFVLYYGNLNSYQTKDVKNFF